MEATWNGYKELTAASSQGSYGVGLHVLAALLDLLHFLDLLVVLADPINAPAQRVKDSWSAGMPLMNSPKNRRNDEGYQYSRHAETQRMTFLWALKICRWFNSMMVRWANYSSVISAEEAILGRRQAKRWKICSPKEKPTKSIGFQEHLVLFSRYYLLISWGFWISGTIKLRKVRTDFYPGTQSSAIRIRPSLCIYS